MTASLWPSRGQPAAMRWRRATVDDVGELGKLNAQLIQDEGHENAMSVPELERRMGDWLVETYVATLFRVRGRTVAYSLHRDDDRGGHYLRQFFVVRGERRKGYGRRAMELLIAEVLRPDARLHLQVLLNNDRARSFYQSLGFEPYALTLEKR